MKTLVHTFTVVFFIILTGCDGKNENKPAGAGGWLKGDNHEKFETVSKHLRGFEISQSPIRK